MFDKSFSFISSMCCVFLSINIKDSVSWNIWITRLIYYGDSDNGLMGKKLNLKQRIIWMIWVRD